MFTVTWVMLLISGILMMAMGAWVIKNEKGAGVANIIFGALFFGYGAYLALVFDGGTYWIPFKAFVLPFITIGYAIKNRKESKTAAQSKQAQMQAQWQPVQQPYGQQPYGQPQPGQWAQAPGQPAAQWAQAPGQPAGQWAPAPGQPVGQWPAGAPQTPWAAAVPPQNAWQPPQNPAPAAPMQPPTAPASPTLSSDDVLGR